MSSEARPPPKLPSGSPSLFNSLSDTFSFHSSPETYIASRVVALQASGDVATNSRQALHVNILGRNVAIISSHAQITHLLSLGDASHDEADPAVVAAAAYKQFMMPFYPSPNLLLSDGVQHAEMRTPWESQMKHLSSRAMQIAKEATKGHFGALVSPEIDLYESLKTLVWKILLQIFLGLDETDALFREAEALQEDLLRGQFSLFPVSIHTPFWQSPRKRGIAAKEKLEKLISKRLETMGDGCPFTRPGMEMPPGVANHTLLFTSSLAVKGIASLLTPFLLNLYLFERGDIPLIDQATALQGEERDALLHSIELETERLSPPIVGIMRRATQDFVIPNGDTQQVDIRIPQGWDAWLYFVGGGRDPAVFGHKCNEFNPERFLNSSSPGGFAFSTGGKQCLGQDLVRTICLGVADGLLEDRVKLTGNVQAQGVRAWLGWESGNVSPEAWARDMKQLPTQRPAKGVRVRLSEGDW